MSDSIFAFILALGGLGAIGFAAVMVVVSRVEARERQRVSKPHAAE